MNSDRKYEQLPLTGETQDINSCYEELEGVRLMHKQITEFMLKNELYNPRQLYFLVQDMAHETHLNILLGIVDSTDLT